MNSNHIVFQPRPELAIALLRASLGTVFLAHCIVLKLFTYTLTGTAAYFVSIGLPALLAYVVFAMEAIGGVLLVLGVGTRLVAAVMVPVMIGALWAHAANGWVFTAVNGGWEYPLILVVLSIAQSLLGSGAFALKPAIARPRNVRAHASA